MNSQVILIIYLLYDSTLLFVIFFDTKFHHFIENDVWTWIFRQTIDTLGVFFDTNFHHFVLSTFFSLSLSPYTGKMKSFWREEVFASDRFVIVLSEKMTSCQCEDFFAFEFWYSFYVIAESVSALLLSSLVSVIGCFLLSFRKLSLTLTSLCWAVWPDWTSWFWNYPEFTENEDFRLHLVFQNFFFSSFLPFWQKVTPLQWY